MAEEFAESILEIPPRSLGQAAGIAAGVSIHQIATFWCDIGGWRERLHAYVVPGLTADVMLGSPWARWAGAVVDMGKGEITIGKAHGMVVTDLNRDTGKNRHGVTVEEEDEDSVDGFWSQWKSGKIIATVRVTHKSAKKC